MRHILMTVMLAGLLCTVAGAKGEKVTICHVPPGNPSNAQTISVAGAAVDAHLSHGDFLGSCQQVGPSDRSFMVFALLMAGWAGLLLSRRFYRQNKSIKS